MGFNESKTGNSVLNRSWYYYNIFSNFANYVRDEYTHEEGISAFELIERTKEKTEAYRKPIPNHTAALIIALWSADAYGELSIGANGTMRTGESAGMVLSSLMYFWLPDYAERLSVFNEDVKDSTKIDDGIDDSKLFEQAMAIAGRITNILKECSYYKYFSRFIIARIISAGIKGKALDLYSTGKLDKNQEMDRYFLIGAKGERKINKVIKSVNRKKIKKEIFKLIDS
jgi:hypothetical protein